MGLTFYFFFVIEQKNSIAMNLMNRENSRITLNRTPIPNKIIWTRTVHEAVEKCTYVRVAVQTRGMSR